MLFLVGQEEGGEGYVQREVNLGWPGVRGSHVHREGAPVWPGGRGGMFTGRLLLDGQEEVGKGHVHREAAPVWPGLYVKVTFSQT